MSQLVVAKQKRAFAPALVGAIAALGASMAMAAPDTAALVTAIGGVETTIDAVGGGMVTVFVGLMVFGIIIGMIVRKGK